MEKLKTFPGQRTLPKSYVNDIAQERNKKAIAATMTAANEALANLHNLACKSFGAANDRSNWPRDWHDLNAEWLKSNIEKRLQSLDTLPFTTAMLDRIRQQWQDTENTAKKWLQALDVVRQLETQGAEIHEGDRHKLICGNADEIAAIGTTYPIGDEPRELWRLIQNVRAEFLKVQRYCKKHSLKELRPADVISKDNPESFVRSWALGLFALSPDAEQQRNYNDFLFHQNENTKPRFIIGQ